ncbi:MAG: bi-domain-containing oxidoreductase [Anaerolineaceae bacterium]|nr:bi-domain-containing oxidoreductase [Anaerolineaceae bacterium]
MKQLLQYMRNGETVIVNSPIPAVRPGTALVKTAASLVSAGTERMVVEFAEKSLLGKAQARPDLVHQMLNKVKNEGLLPTLEATFNRLGQPMPLGYSSAGTVVAVGEGLSGIQPGHRVACAGGGFAVHAEYAVVPKNLLTPLPDQVDFESAAFATLGAISLHGFRLAKPQIGSSVAVIGLGLLGLLAAGIARASGCQVFGIDMNHNRVAFARLLGITACLRSEAETLAPSFTQNHGYDAVLICADTSSSDPVILAGELARDKGEVVAIGAVGLQLPRKVYYEKELNFQVSRSYGPGRYDINYEEKGNDYPYGFVRWTENRNIETFVELMAKQLVDVHPLITHRFAIEDAPQAYELITGKIPEPYLGILLTYPEAPIEEEGRILINLPTPHAGEKSLSLGVLGAGNYARAVFLPLISKTAGVHNHSIASITGMNAAHAARKYGFQYALSEEDQVLSSPEINVVAILTQHQHHARQVCTALASGKNVYCEKPLALNRRELEEIFQILDQPGVPLLTVGFNRRFSPLSTRLKEIIGRSPEPINIHYRVNAGFLPKDHWLHDPQKGGGRIIGEACHFIDYMIDLTNQLPTQVFAQSLPDAGKYHQDNVTAVLTFANGSLGTLQYLANGDKSCPKERIEVFTAGEIAILDDFRSLEWVAQGQKKRTRSWFKQDKGHTASWAAFLKAIREPLPPPIPYVQLWAGAVASFAVMESLRTGSPVHLPKILTES